MTCPSDHPIAIPWAAGRTGEKVGPQKRMGLLGDRRSVPGSLGRIGVLEKEAEAHEEHFSPPLKEGMRVNSLVASGGLVWWPWMTYNP